MARNLVKNTLFFATVLIGCEKQNNNIRTLELECGMVAGDLKEGDSIIKVVGDGVDSLNISNLTALALDAEDREIPIKMSSRGCAAIPNQVISIRIKNTIDGQNLALAVNRSEFSKEIISKFALKQESTISANFNCPSDGFFGKEMVDIGLNIRTEGREEETAIQILARDVQSRQTFVILEKKFGFPIKNYGKKIDISSLKAGTFQLELATASLSTGLHENYALISNSSSCLLNKVASMPILAKSNEAIVKKGSRIFDESFSQQTFSCLSELKDVSDQNTCETTTKCSSLENFSDATGLTYLQTGSYRYYYYKKDRANEITNISCKDVIVSDSAPALSIDWKNPRYSKPGASIDIPYVHLALAIRSEHPSISKEKLEKNFLCSATFRTADNIEIPAAAVKCDSIECKGMNLSQPVPCGSELILNMKEVYDSTSLWDSVLKIKVESDDGTGYRSSSEAGVWLASSRWLVQDELEDLQLEATNAVGEMQRYRHELRKLGKSIVFESSRVRGIDDSKLGAAIIYSGGKRSVFKSMEAELTSPHVLKNEGSDDVYIQWDVPTYYSDRPKLVKYSGDTAHEVPTKLENLNSLLLWEYSFGYLWGLAIDPNDGSSFRPVRFDGQKWDVFEALEKSFFFSPISLDFSAFSNKEFAFSFDELNYKVRYKEGHRHEEGNPLGENPNLAAFDSILRAKNDPMRCTDEGAYIDNNEVYFPMKKLIERYNSKASEHPNASQVYSPWESQGCKISAAEGHSILLITSDRLLRFKISKSVEMTTAHTSLRRTALPIEAIIEGDNVHPLVVSPPKELKVLDSFQFKELLIPEGLKNILDSRTLSINVSSQGKISLSADNSDTWISNEFKDWERPSSSNHFKFIPIWKHVERDFCQSAFQLFIPLLPTDEGLSSNDDRICWRTRLGDALSSGAESPTHTISNPREHLIVESNKLSTMKWNPEFEISLPCEPTIIPRIDKFEDVLKFSCLNGDRSYQIDLATKAISEIRGEFVPLTPEENAKLIWNDGYILYPIPE